MTGDIIERQGSILAWKRLLNTQRITLMIFNQQSKNRGEYKAKEKWEPHFVTPGGAINQCCSEQNIVTQKTFDY